MSEYVRITDVSPRDGLQNEAGVITTADKARLVELLCATGVDEIEVTSFVSPKWVPQLGDAVELMGLVAEGFRDHGGKTRAVFSALAPNEKGMQSLLDVNDKAGRALIQKVAVFTAASETFNKKNTNATIAESIERFRPIVMAAKQHGLMVRGYVSCVIACPFEGPIGPAAVVDVCSRLLDLADEADVDMELDLGDTIGAAKPETLGSLLDAMHTAFDREMLSDADFFTLHLHDTFGRAAECVNAALEMGVRSFDGSVAGLGGCPYASTPGPPPKRAPGNISTETLVRTVHEAGFETNVDMERLELAAATAREIVGKARLAAAANPSERGQA